MVRRLAVAAGHLTLDYFDQNTGASTGEKRDGSPVTPADHAAEEVIIKGLRDLTPDIPVIAEETASAGNFPDTVLQQYLWLVDPIDATREFIAGGENYTVNIGLVRKGTPVLGVVYAPALGVLYAGYGDKAIRWSEDTGKDKTISVRLPPPEGLTVMSSLYHADDTRLDKFLQPFKVAKILKRPSSLKICMVAEGKADLYPRLGPTSEWDTAAGEAILRAAGGNLSDMKGHPLVYGGKGQNFINPEFVASSFNWSAASEG